VSAAMEGFSLNHGKVSIADPQVFVSWVTTNGRAADTERELNQGEIESRINRVRQLLGPSKSDASSKVQVIVSDGTQPGDLVRFDYNDLQYATLLFPMA
jgi:hypothetical protein